MHIDVHDRGVESECHERSEEGETPSHGRNELATLMCTKDTGQYQSRKFTLPEKDELKSFMNKQVLRDFIPTRPALQELLKEALYIERNNQY